MLKMLVVTLALLLSLAYAHAADIPEQNFFELNKTAIKVCIDNEGANFKGEYNLCSRSWGTNLGYWVTLTNLGTGEVTRLPDAELGVTIGKFGTGEFPKEFIIYNPSFTAITSWTTLPEHVWCEYYSVTAEGRFVFEFRTKNPFME